MDDSILLDDDKRIFKEWRERIEEKLAELRLRIHPSKSVIRRSDEGLPSRQ